MRFLHTSDWHLGKIFHERPLIEDQKYFLDQIVQQLEMGDKENNPYSAVLVPGDIYDRVVPSKEATLLLSEFLTEVNKKFPELHWFFISGNHDSASRLSFASYFLNEHNIHIVTDTNNFTTPIVLQKGDEKVCVYQLPFLNPLSIKKDDDENQSEIYLRSQQEMYEEACRRIQENHTKNYKGIPSVLCAHLFTLGSMVGGSERSNVGTAEQVDVNLFKDFSYGAFGHIHGKQICDKEHRCWYSGAPLAYNFDDKPDTVMLDVEISSDISQKPVVKEIPFKALHPVVILEGKVEDFYGSKVDSNKWAEYKDCYVKINITDKVHIDNYFRLLQTVFPLLLMAPRVENSASQSSESIQKRKEAIDTKQPEKIFEQFLKDVYGNALEDCELVQKEKELMKKEAMEINWGDAE